MLPDPSASRAVLIGTSRYTHSSLDDLPAVDANLEAFAELLRSPDVWGLLAQNCVIVSNPATIEEMIDPIVQAAAQATDTLLVYYAGHGLVARLASELHLALTGSVKPNASYTAVSYGLIREELASARTKCQVVILDCCFSGRALGRMAGGDSAAIVADEAVIEGTYLIAAAAETRTAVSVPGERHTAFTAELLAVLRRGLPGKGPYLDLDTVYREIEVSLRAKQRPLPQSRVRNTAGRLAFRNRAFSDRYQHWRDLVAEAERTARTLTNPEGALGWVITGMARHDPAEAERLARTITDPEDRALRLSQVAGTLARTDPADAERLARTISNPEHRAGALHEIVEVLAGRDPAAAERVARTIALPMYWASALRMIAKELVGRDPRRALGLLAEVEHFARTLVDPWGRADQLKCIAVVLVEHDPGQALNLLTEVERLTRASTDVRYPYASYMELWEGVAALAVHAPAEAERFVHAITEDANPGARTGLLTTIVTVLAEHAPAVAERIAYTINDPDFTSFGLEEIVEVLAVQDPDAAERITRTIAHPTEWSPALCTIARALVERDPRRALDLLAEAEHLTRTHRNPLEQAHELAPIAALLAHFNPNRGLDLLAEAEHLARTGPGADALREFAAQDPFGREPETIALDFEVASLRAIAAAWVDQDPGRAADLMVEAARRGRRHSYRHHDIVVKALAGRDPAAAERVARLAPNPGLPTNPYGQAQAMRGFVEVLAVQNPTEAERLSRTLTDPEEQSRALTIVVEALIDRDLTGAERIARTLPNPHDKIHMLGRIAQALP